MRESWSASSDTKRKTAATDLHDLTDKTKRKSLDPCESVKIRGQILTAVLISLLLFVPLLP
jgi:hypothetical protein